MVQAYQKSGLDNNGKQCYKLVDTNYVIDEFSIADLDNQITRAEQEVDRLKALKATVEKV